MVFTYHAHKKLHCLHISYVQAHIYLTDFVLGKKKKALFFSTITVYSFFTTVLKHHFSCYSDNKAKIHIRTSQMGTVRERKGMYLCNTYYKLLLTFCGNNMVKNWHMTEQHVTQSSANNWTNFLPNSKCCKLCMFYYIVGREVCDDACLDEVIAAVLKHQVCKTCWKANLFFPPSFSEWVNILTNMSLYWLPRKKSLCLANKLL